MPKKIVILTPNPFPIGNVATNRFATYAKVLAAEGFKVCVAILKGTEDWVNPVNKDRSGVYEGIKYEYMASTSRWDKNAPYLKKIYLYGTGLIKSVVYLKKEKPDSVLMYTND